MKTDLKLNESMSGYKENGKIAVALSGGVDSAFAAKILREKGYEVLGITMQILKAETSIKMERDDSSLDSHIYFARMVSEKLGIPHFIINLEKEFEEIIINPFCEEYLRGNTPNPCVECNKYIKFGRLLAASRELGADYIATGHYCNVSKNMESGLYEVSKGIDKSKDQSYFFWKLDQCQLANIKTPLGNYLKQEVSTISEKIFPFLIEKSESQDVCFISGRRYQDFLESRIESIPGGRIVDTRGRTIGCHRGLPFYTIGQRKGLGVSHTEPLYVKEMIPEKNIIVAATEKEIYSKGMRIGKINFISGKPPGKLFKANVRIRYNSSEKAASVKMTGESEAEIFFDLPCKAVTPGQSAVFYSGDLMIGGGIIKTAI